MIPMSLAEVAAAVGGVLDGGADGAAMVTGAVVADSRKAEPGSLFVALPGERVDGHHFADAALRAGAVAVLSARPLLVPCVVVDDPLTALGALARAVVDRAVGDPAAPGLTVVAVTGSSGKTSTKDLLAAVLASVGETVVPPGSFNNELGAPLTALRVEPSTRYLVAEMGARNPGNITYLCAVTPPRIGVVLNVGSAHVGVFGSKEVIARTKGELVEALDENGVAVLNADDPLVRAMATRSRARVVLVGRSPDADVRAVDVQLDALARPRFRLVTPAGEADVALALHGEHHVGNALAAAAVGLEVGLTPQQVADVLARSAAASRWRMEVIERSDGVLVVNDAYNANPDSVRAALQALAAMAGAELPRRTWAVLGEMLELGPASEQEHEAVGRLAVHLGISRVVAVGPGAARAIHEAALAEGAVAQEDTVWLPDVDVAAAHLSASLTGGDVVLVKASRAVGLDRLAQALLDGEARQESAQ